MSSTLLPFLYQTRTLRRALRGPLPSLVRAVHATPPYYQPKKASDDDSVPFDFGPDQHGLAASLRRRDKTSTITESEQRVFDEIFGAISKRRKQLGGGPILPDVEPPAFEGVADEVSAGGKSEQELKRERILSMYPPALRRAAEIALGLQEQEDKEVSQTASEAEAELDEELARRDAAAKKQQREAKRAMVAFHNAEKARLQSLMQSCPTDTAVWEVLEEHVFSMVERLGINEPKRKGEKTPKRTEASQGSLSMERYGPLYSLHLLSGLRHLDRGFVTPSPLALNVLPRVLELGMASYVLGVSTRFYNELMSIYWYRHGDAASVMRLLREMERAGLSPDGQTLKIVEAVTVALDGLSGGSAERNPFGEVLSTMQEYDSVVLAKLAARRKWVLASIEERASELPL
ncbi:hypothetical protein VUR80DRAFT_5527 [Thermomyces stellatus]